MSFYPSLYKSDYTISNALFWGVSLGHLGQIREETKWHGRVIHLIVGVVEAIPIVGQIVSLLELGVIRFFSLSKKFELSGSSIPKLDLNQYQALSNTFYWPVQMNDFGIEQQQTFKLDSDLRTFLRGEICLPGKIGFRSEAPNVPPISATICRVNDVTHVLLCLKKIFAVGGERKIRWVYDIMAGKFFLKKRLVGVFEKKIIKHMEEARERRGIQSRTIWRQTIDKKNGEIKEQIIEPVRDGIVSMLFGTKLFEKFSNKRSVILDLLQDLYALHQLYMFHISINRGGAKFPIPPYFAYHSDIKLENTLVFVENDRLGAVLCDFGKGASDPAVMMMSLGYTPPEHIHFCLQSCYTSTTLPSNDEFSDLITFNHEHGRYRDIWSMGLVLVSILAGRYGLIEHARLNGKFFVAPLPSLINNIQDSLNSEMTNHEPDWIRAENGILNLTQERLDEDIENLRKKVLEMHRDETKSVNNSFDAIKLMLRIKPEERKMAEEFLLMIK